jgi:toxin ParE1/3/4
VATFRFSRRAVADLLTIGRYTLETWGETQTAHCLDELESCCQKLAKNPALGRIADEVRRGLRRHEHPKHVIFYREDRKGIVIVRILHQRVLPERHDHDEDTD